MPSKRRGPRSRADAQLTAVLLQFFCSSRRRHTRCLSDWSSDVCSSDLSPDGVTTFGTQSNSNNGTITASGQNIAAALNISLPSPVTAYRPFYFTDNTSGDFSPEWSDPIYSAQRLHLSAGPVYYR